MFKEYSDRYGKSKEEQSDNSKNSKAQASPYAETESSLSMDLVEDGFGYKRIDRRYKQKLNEGMKDKRGELEIYLKEDVENPDLMVGVEYAVLSYLKRNCTKFPILFLMAKDIMTMVFINLRVYCRINYNKLYIYIKNENLYLAIIKNYKITNLVKLFNSKKFTRIELTFRTFYKFICLIYSYTMQINYIIILHNNNNNYFFLKIILLSIKKKRGVMRLSAKSKKRRDKLRCLCVQMSDALPFYCSSQPALRFYSSKLKVI